MLSLYYENINSVWKNYHKAYDELADILAFSEIYSKHQYEFTKLIGKQRKICKDDQICKTGGGVLIAARRWFRSNQVKAPKFEEFELVCLRVEFPFKNIFIVCVYVPSDSPPAAYNILKDAIKATLAHRDDDIALLIGDFNFPTKGTTKATFTARLQRIGLFECTSNEEHTNYFDNELDTVFCSNPELLTITMNIASKHKENPLIRKSFCAAISIQINIEGLTLDPNSATSIMKNDHLIQVIEREPQLYDKSNTKYWNGELRLQTWKQIALELGLTVEECRRRWSSLRNQFRKHKKQSRFFKGMSFIKPYLENYEESEETGITWLDIDTSSIQSGSSENMEVEHASWANTTGNPECSQSLTTSTDISYQTSLDTTLENENAEFSVLHRIQNINQIDERPYVCTFENCGSRFTTSTNLYRHERRHTGQKDYSCELCHKRFARKDSMVKHVKGHEKKDLEWSEIMGK